MDDKVRSSRCYQLPGPSLNEITMSSPNTFLISNRFIPVFLSMSRPTWTQALVRKSIVHLSIVSPVSPNLVYREINSLSHIAIKIDCSLIISDYVISETWPWSPGTAIEMFAIYQLETIKLQPLFYRWYRILVLNTKIFLEIIFAIDTFVKRLE